METLDEPSVEPTPAAPPEPQPAPEPVAVPAPEPEAPPVEPSWLTAAPAAPEPAPQQQRYQEPPPQQQQYQQPQHVPSGNLEALVENPDAYIDRIVAQRVQQMVGPLYNDYQQTKAQQIRTQQTQTQSMISQADSAIKNAYKSFNQDPAFRSNPNVQARVENSLKGIREQAIIAAEYGDYSNLYNLANMNEGHYRAALAAARAIEGIGSPGVGPLQIEGASVESSRAPVADTHVELSAEQQEIANRIGGNYADRLRSALKETQAADDFEWGG